MIEKKQTSTKIALITKTNLTSDIWQFEFEKPANYSFLPGQYNEYHLPVSQNEDDNRRWFTNSAAPVEDVIRITTRINEHSSEFKKKLFSLTTGSTIEHKGPMGDFTLLQNKNTPLLFIAGGIGITPFRSILKQLASSGEHRQITLIYGARTPNDFVFGELFDQIERDWGESFRYVKVASEPDERWRGLNGQITDKIITDSSRKLASSVVYVSGPEPMVDAFEPRLIGLGFQKDNIKQDWFPGYPAEY